MGWLSDDDRNTPQGNNWTKARVLFCFFIISINSKIVFANFSPVISCLHYYYFKYYYLLFINLLTCPYRYTCAAFSHFTYEASKHEILICDLQGVGDLYTDPQVWKNTMPKRKQHMNIRTLVAILPQKGEGHTSIKKLTCKLAPAKKARICAQHF